MTTPDESRLSRRADCPSSRFCSSRAGHSALERELPSGESALAHGTIDGPEAILSRLIGGVRAAPVRVSPSGCLPEGDTLRAGTAPISPQDIGERGQNRRRVTFVNAGADDGRLVREQSARLSSACRRPSHRRSLSGGARRRSSSTGRHLVPSRSTGWAARRSIVKSFPNLQSAMRLSGYPTNHQRINTLALKR